MAAFVNTSYLNRSGEKPDLPNILENRRRVTKKNVAILADSLPLSASRHNTMFLKKLATSPVGLF